MRKNFFFIFFTLSLLIIYGFLVSSIDLKYQVEKKEYIVNNFRRFFDLDRSEILSLIKRGEEEEEAFLELEEKFAGIIEEPEQPIYSIALVDDEREILLEKTNKEKLRTHNTLRTALFYQNFNGLYSFGEDDLAYSVECTYTTPKHDAFIQQMTIRYWRLISVITPFFVIFYILIIKYYILPVKKVINSLLLIPRRKNVLVPAPLTLLEKSFNLVGLYYQLLSFTNSIYEEIFSRRSLRNEEDVEKVVVDFIPRYFHCKEVLCYHVPVADAVHLPTTGILESSEELPSPIAHRLAGGTFEKLSPLAALKVPLKDEVLYFLLSFQGHNPRLMSFNFEEFLQRFEHILYLTFNYTRLKGAEIIEEKQRANVNLVRNLGHDLTNILATLKLEIANLSFLVQEKLGEEEEGTDRESQDLLKRVRDNARFLQDIVDIYRSLSYMENPRFEEIELGNILQHTFQLFKHATSHRIQWLFHKPQEAISMKVEPRLLQLAFFNLLSNAYDAVKERQSPDFSPHIEAGMSFLSGSSGEVLIYIQDNGAGIRDGHGNLLSGKQLDEIFQYGYTTKKKEKGEGLGLSWVKTIVEEFHHGTIQAHNREEGGARFEILLPHGGIKE